MEFGSTIMNFLMGIASIIEKHSRGRIMKSLHALFLIIGVFCFEFPAFPQESKIVIVNTASKELKRTARRLRIPVEQLKKARQALQEATDLVKKTKPFPSSQLSSLKESWRQLNRSRAKEVDDSFIQDLRSEAAHAADFNAYQQATSAAMSFGQSFGDSDYEKMQELVRSWPDPPASAGEAGEKFRSNMEANVRQNALSYLANSDPEKARTLLAQAGNSSGYNYSISGQIARGLMNAGKKDESLAMIDQTINDFRQHSADPQAFQAYQSFVQMTAGSLGVARAGALMAPLLAQFKTQASSENCASGIMKAGDLSVDLTCGEWGVLNMLRSYPFQTMPGLVNTTLNSFPSLKSKLDQVGGIDNAYGNSGVNISVNYPKGISYQTSVGSGSTDTVSKLIRELKGKAVSNPGFVRGKLKDIAKGEQGINALINLAQSASYDDPDLASLALDVAKPLLPQVESLQRRSSILQNMIRAYRQADGEVDSEILRDGFVLADQLREETEKSSEPMAVARFAIQLGAQSWRTQEPDRLEAFLVSELSKDDYEKAINYVRSIKNENLKLTCLIQIVQALSQQNY
jgi:hypothetical protein